MATSRETVAHNLLRECPPEALADHQALVQLVQEGVGKSTILMTPQAWRWPKTYGYLCRELIDGLPIYSYRVSDYIEGGLEVERFTLVPRLARTVMGDALVLGSTTNSEMWATWLASLRGRRSGNPGVVSPCSSFLVSLMASAPMTSAPAPWPLSAKMPSTTQSRRPA